MPKKRASEGLSAQRSVRLTEAVDSALEEFCRKTRRDTTATIRAIIELFLQDGPDVASDRLNRGLWDEKRMTTEEARELAEKIVRDAQAASEAAKQKAAREKRRPA